MAASRNERERELAILTHSKAGLAKLDGIYSRTLGRPAGTTVAPGWRIADAIKVILDREFPANVP